MNMENINAAVSYMLAAAILVVLIYFLPGVFIGLVFGLALGKNYDKLVAWIDKKEEEQETANPDNNN